MEDNKTIYLSDNPNTEQDSFKIHTSIADTLYEIITKHDVSISSFTIGLFGEWGSGKSFIINKLSEKIKKNHKKDTTYLYIDIWKYSGFPLLRSILFDLDKQFKRLHNKDKEKYKDFENGYKKNGHSLDFQLKYNKHLKEESKLTPKESWQKIYETIKKYKIAWVILFIFLLVFLAPLFIPETFVKSNTYKNFIPFLNAIKSFVSFTGIGAVILLLLKKPINDIGNLIFFRSVVRDYTEQANFSPEQFEDIFKDMLGKITNEKYVIVFDNLDRCEPNVAYETLSTIKTFMDVKNCFYIIPADDDAIKNYLSNSTSTHNDTENNFERKFTEEFIDKIFQTYIRIPTLKEVERDNYIKNQLIKIDFQDKITEDDIETITQILYFAYKGESPRNIIRFINDYSTYFQLALRSLPKLLENIMLFTIMIAIKQKWYHFEKILLENPDFFDKYPSNIKLLSDIDKNDIKDLENFLNSILSYYIPQIKNNSIDEYIHFKESEKSYDISEILKNNQPIDFEVNEENIKILNREFNKLVKIKGQFSINSFITFARLISNNKKHRLYKNIVTNFWLGFIQTPKEQVKSIFGELLDDEILIKIINSLNIKNLFAHKVKIENKIIDYFKEPLVNKSEFKEYEKVFENFMGSEYKFTPTLLKELFTQWEKNNQYLNSLIKIISENKKPDYLPDNVIGFLVKNTIDDKSIELMNYWSENIPNNFGVLLTSKLADRLKNRDISNYPNLNSLKPQLGQDFKILLFISTSFINNNNKVEFLESLYNTSSRILQFANNQQPLLELGIKFWIEIVHFTDIDRENIDNKLHQLFNSFIKTNSTTISILEGKIKYPNELLSLKKLKLALFNISENLQTKIYEKLDDKYLSKFALVMPYPVEIKNITTYVDYLKTKNITVDKNKLSEFLLKSILKELINSKIDISNKLKYLVNNYDLKLHKKIILENKNGIIDLYKENPTKYQKILLQVKMILPYREFFNNIIKPILVYIKSELSKSESISKFISLSELIESTNNEKDINLLITILSNCLEKNQSIEENYLGIKILSKIHNNISTEQKDGIEKLITSNDKYDEWDENVIQILTEIGISKKDDNNE